MKFTWFNLMPWPYLPDDFREKHRSVWVDIDYSLYDPVKGHEVYNTYLDELEYAESLGYDGIGVNEHHANGYGLMPSPNIMAATLARRTSKSAAGGARQLHRAVQPAHSRGGGVRHARRHLRRAAAGRLPGRHVHGHQLLLRQIPGAAPARSTRKPTT
jgi:sugar phosphate isomerase/epimerase